MREKWVDNIKFLAAGGVFLCHFTESFAVSGARIPAWLEFVNKYPLNMVLNGEFWVCIFAILSGYLLSKKNVVSIKYLIKISINRYFRFAVPFFFANFFVYILYHTVGFSAKECGIVIENEWLMHQYTIPINIISVLKNSFLLGSELNENFWIIKHMLIASWLIYISNYICHKLKNENLKIAIAIGLLMFPYTFFIGTVYLGSLFNMLTKKIKLHSNTVLIIFSIMVLLMSGMQNAIAETIGVDWIHINQYWEMFYAVGMLLCIRLAKQLLNLFNRCFVNKISNQSMTIYLLHWPIMCSFSTWCFITLMKKGNSFSFYYWITLGVTIVILEGVVYCYDKVVGRFSDLLLRKIILK